MLLTIELMAIIICTLMCITPIRKIISGSFNIMYFCMLSFWIGQVFPLIMKMLFGVDSLLSRYPKTYQAMNDIPTCIVYTLFVVVTEFYIYVMAKAIPNSRINFRTTKIDLFRISSKKYVKALLYIGMFFEIFFIPISPDPSIYFKFSYFYTNIVKENAPEYVFHYTTMSLVTRVAFFCVILFYLLYFETKEKWIVYPAIVIITWINGKRTLLTILLLAILVIDFVKTTSITERKKVLGKAVLFCAALVFYFKLYSQITGKFASASFNFQYSIYFGRMSNVDACIYAELNNESILAYRGQSILYDLFFWIPRSLWRSKPVLYSKYFTAYVMGYNSINIDWQFQTNIWSEYISNFSFIGPFIAIGVLYVISYFSHKSNNVIVYIAGLVYAVMYTMYGFEAMVQILGALWFVLICFNRLKFSHKGYEYLANKHCDLGG